MAARLLLALAALLLPAIAAGSLLDDAQRHHCGGTCPHGSATAALRASLHSSGAHRQLAYRLRLQCPMAAPAAGKEAPAAAAAAATQQPPPSRCGEAVLLQPLPPAIFADVYQLDNAAAVGQGPAVRLFGPVDVESIERFSQPTVLAVNSGTTQAPGQQEANCTELTLAVPLHARYPHPTEPQQAAPAPGWRRWLGSLRSAAAVAELPPPLVLVRCPAADGERAAEWQAAAVQPLSDAGAAEQPVRWVLPAGNLRHGPLVAAGTAAALGCGVAAVLAALFLPLSRPQRTQRKRAKQA